MQDLRSFLERIAGHVTRVSRPAPLDAIAALCGQSPGPILFEQIEDHPGWRLCDIFFKTRALQALTMGTTPENVLRWMGQKLAEGPLPAVVVPTGPVKEIRLTGQDADMTRLPVPVHSADDIGPYIAAMSCLKDPDTGIQNTAIVRTLVGGPRHGVSSYVTRHSIELCRRYRELRRPMPQAIVIGVHPLVELASCYSGRHESWSELDLAGRLLGEPLELVPCETIDLMVPAHAEVVIEGYIYPDRLDVDGPSPSPNCLLVPRAQQMPVFEVTAITMRHNPIYRHFQAVPFTDHQPLPRLFHQAILFQRLTEAGYKVHDVVYPPWGAVNTCIVQMTPAHEGQAVDAMLMLMGAPWPHAKIAIAVDEDIDPHSAEDVFWAIATRVDPSRQVNMINGARGYAADPAATLLHPDFPFRISGKMAIDATKPPAYRPNRQDFKRSWPARWDEVRLKDFLGD
ncbi:MAG TPA: UbiD family decarboxylase [Symbiobacteriaceae bacterium]|nr:UbiD family decarboxylase [Symbiobacteriaceae bacterium]